MIALIGNPNAGKTTLFNKLTNSSGYVGNYSGATVELKKGKYHGRYIIDLPGIYSLIPFTKEEEITVNFLKNNKLDLIINVIDINQINRSLYLTSRLMDLHIPIMIILTKRNKKTKIDINKLTNILGINIVYSNNVDKLKGSISNKAFDNNSDIYEDIESRYKLIDEICSKVMVNNNSNNKFDNILLNKNISLITNILLFIFIYYISINIVGNYLIKIVSNIFNMFINYIINIVNSMNTNIIFKDLITRGVLGGISNIISFIPIIIIFTFIITILEDSGYITRMSLIYDNFLRIIGLSGKSFIPLLLGSTCSVLGIMNTRTIKDKKQRLKTIFLIPFIPCSAKVTVMIYITTIFFHKSFIIFLSFYLICILVIIISSFLFKNSSKSFIIDIPKLKVPSIKLAIKNTYNKTKSYLFRIITVIMFISIVNYLIIYNTNIISLLSHKDIISIISGLIAKEQVISTMSLLGNNLNRVSAYIFCIFNIITIPCINTITVIKKECGFRKMVLYLLLYLLISYIASFIIYVFLNSY